MKILAKKEKKKGFFQEFREFAMQGSLFDMAIGVIVGGIFKDLVTAFTDKLLMPILSIFTGSIDFSAWRIELPSLFGEKLAEDGTVVKNYLEFGSFLSSLISFLILAFVIFLMVKGVNRVRELGKKQEEEAPAEPPKPSNEEVLLTEIRDLLKEKQ